MTDRQEKLQPAIDVFKKLEGRIYEEAVSFCKMNIEDFGDGDVTVINGDYTADRLELGYRDCVVILGDVSIKHAISMHEDSFLIVLGHVKCHGLMGNYASTIVMCNGMTTHVFCADYYDMVTYGRGQFKIDIAFCNDTWLDIVDEGKTTGKFLEGGIQGETAFDYKNVSLLEHLKDGLYTFENDFKLIPEFDAMSNDEREEADQINGWDYDDYIDAKCDNVQLDKVKLRNMVLNGESLFR